MDNGYAEEAKLILRDPIDRHNDKVCDCNFIKETGEIELVCTAGMWLYGFIPNKQVVQDYHAEYYRRNRRKTKG